MFFDGGTQIVLVNKANNKKLVCSDSFNLARPLPSYTYVVANRKILCNCRLKEELTYLLKSTGSCSDANKDLTLYFTINLAFYHYMNSYINNNDTIVLNTGTLTAKGFAIALHPIIAVSGQPIFEQPDTLKELNHNYIMKYKGLHPKIPDPITEGDNFTTKLLITIWDSMIFKILVLCLTILGALSTIPIIRLFSKHKKLKTLVTSIALYKRSHVDTQPITDNKNVVFQDPWVSFLVTLITIIGIIFYIWHHCRKFTLYKGYRYEGADKCYIFLSHTSYIYKRYWWTLTSYTLSKLLNHEQLRLHQNYLWDTIHINRKNVILKVANKTISLPTVITVPLTGKIRTRIIFHKENIVAHFMV